MRVDRLSSKIPLFFPGIWLKLDGTHIVENVALTGFLYSRVLSLKVYHDIAY